MRITRTIRLITLCLILLLVASACGGIESATERVSGTFGESTSDRLSERVDDTLARLSNGYGSDLEVLSSDTVTLEQLHAAGIPLGSQQIACDQPLDIVVVEGIFDRENIFTTGATLAGGSFEGLAMRLVARVYDPETDMPLGMIGGEGGGQLNNILEDSSRSNNSIDSTLMFEPEENTNAGTLVPEAVCQ